MTLIDDSEPDIKESEIPTHAVIVNLNLDEMEEADLCAAIRYIEVINRGYKESLNYRCDISRLERHMIGARGERAVATYLKVPWTHTKDGFREYPDVGSFEVRTSRTMIVRARADDPANRTVIFVLRRTNSRHAILGFETIRGIREKSIAGFPDGTRWMWADTLRPIQDLPRAGVRSAPTLPA